MGNPWIWRAEVSCLRESKLACFSEVGPLNPSREVELGMAATHKGALTVTEMDRLDALLKAMQKPVSSLEMLDGFLTALQLSPRPTPDLMVVRALLTAKSRLDHPLVGSQEDAREYLDLVLRHRSHLQSTLAQRHIYLTVLHERPPRKAAVAAWCTGFVRGLNEHKDDWRPLLRQHRTSRWIAPICRMGGGGAHWLSETSRMPPTLAVAGSERLQIIVCLSRLTLEILFGGSGSRPKLSDEPGPSFREKPSRLN